MQGALIICQLPCHEIYLFSFIDDDQDLGKVLRQSQTDFDRAEELRRQEEEDLQKAINESLKPSTSTTTETVGEDHHLPAPEVPVNAPESGQVFFLKTCSKFASTY